MFVVAGEESEQCSG